MASISPYHKGNAQALEATNRPGESYSDVILRLAKGDAAGVTRRPHPYFYLLSRRRVGCNAGGVDARRLNPVHEAPSALRAAYFGAYCVRANSRRNH